MVRAPARGSPPRSRRRCATWARSPPRPANTREAAVEPLERGSRAPAGGSRRSPAAASATAGAAVTWRAPRIRRGGAALGAAAERLGAAQLLAAQRHRSAPPRSTRSAGTGPAGPGRRRGTRARRRTAPGRRRAPRSSRAVTSARQPMASACADDQHHAERGRAVRPGTRWRGTGCAPPEPVAGVGRLARQSDARPAATSWIVSQAASYASTRRVWTVASASAGLRWLDVVEPLQRRLPVAVVPGGERGEEQAPRPRAAPAPCAVGRDAIHTAPATATADHGAHRARTAAARRRSRSSADRGEPACDRPAPCVTSIAAGIGGHAAQAAEVVHLVGEAAHAPVVHVTARDHVAEERLDDRARAAERCRCHPAPDRHAEVPGLVSAARAPSQNQTTRDVDHARHHRQRLDPASRRRTTTAGRPPRTARRRGRAPGPMKPAPGPAHGDQRQHRQPEARRRTAGPDAVSPAPGAATMKPAQHEPDVVEGSASPRPSSARPPGCDGYRQCAALRQARAAGAQSHRREDDAESRPSRRRPTRG